MAKTDTLHPTPQQLAQYDLGKLDRAASAQIESHLRGCAECQQALAGQPTRSLAGQAPGQDTTAAEPRGQPMPASGSGERKLPEQFGRYTIKKMIGQGGMGAVYLAHDRQLDREVGLKVPRIMADDHPDVLQRFYREARAAATFNHPNLCPVYEVDQQDGIHYLTMPFIKGTSLAKYLQKTGPLPLRQAAALVRKLALAMHEAHAKGVIHRDLKPGNVMINQRGEPVIMDFGLARRDQAADSRLTHSGAVMGTPAYMPPEQVSGDQQAIGPCTDIYSLGVILYELVTGRLPFQGSPALQMGLVMTKEPDRPSSLRPDLDGQLEAICLRAMMKQPADRYSSMKAFADDLTAYLKAKAPSTAGPAKTRDMDGPVLLEFADEPEQRAFQQRPRKGFSPQTWWLLIVGGAAALVILVGVVIAVQWNSGTKTTVEPEEQHPGVQASAPADANGNGTVTRPAAAGAERRELLRNGGAEEPQQGSSIPGWTIVRGKWGRRMQAPLPYEGKAYFYAEQSPIAVLRQDVNVESFATSIDAGKQVFEFQAHVRSFNQKPPDTTRIMVEYRDSASGTALKTYDSGRVAHTERWGKLTDTRAAPKGTRLIRVLLISARQDGKDNDGYFDAVSLKAVIEPPQPGSPTLTSPTNARAGSPTDLIREGRIPAPDLSNAKVLHADEFDNPRSGFPVSAAADMTRGYQGGKYFIRRTKPGGGWTPGPWKNVGDCACLCVGRVHGGPDKLWGIELNNDARKKGVGVYISGRGELRLHPTYTQGLGHFPPPYHDDMPHPAIKPGNEINTLLVIARGRTIEVYVNGVAVCEPMTVDFEFLPCQLDLFSAGEAEFERLTLYSAEGLPWLADRLGTGRQGLP